MKGKFQANQHGITLIGFLIVIAVVGFFAFMGMRLFPVYSEYYGVVSSMKGVAEEPGVANMDPGRVRDLLDRRFNISYVESVKREHIKITRDANGYRLQITYEKRGPLVGNLDFVASFDKTVELGRGGGQ